MVCYAKDMLGALQNLHVWDSGTKISDKTHQVSKNIAGCGLWVTIFKKRRR